MKDKTTAIILSALLGGLGVDRFYLGYTGMGVLKLLTGGCFGVLWILDIINIASGKLQPADGSGYSTENFGMNSKPSTVTNLDPMARTGTRADYLASVEQFLQHHARQNIYA